MTPRPLELLAAALAAIDEQAGRLAATEAEAGELRAELEATNRGLLAIHAELSAHTDQLDRARATAEEASKLKAAFLANMSHEIRSPMSAVLGFTALLMESGLTPEQREFAEAVHTAGNHLLRLIDDILDLSKIESGHLDLEDIPFELVTCVEDAVGIVAPAAGQKDLALAALFAPGVPEVVSGDPGRLRQILVNLLSNAVKFTTRGEVTVEVEQVAGEPGRLAFGVRDTGPGMTAETIERLFAPFTQADASITRTFGGTGLGLSISRQLAERMGGGMTVTSKAGAGSTFTCTVALPPVAGGPAAEATDGRLAGARVLVAHEHAVVAEALRRHLSGWGARVVTAPTVAEAAERAAGWGGADLAVVGATGKPVAGLPTGPDGRTPPVVLVAPLGAHASAEGVHAVISAPVHRSQLREAVVAAVGRREVTTGQAATVAVPRTGRPLRILLAEDNELNQRTARLMLDRLGHDVDVVEDGTQAVTAAVSGEYDLVLMDLQMPRLDGLAAARAIRALRPGDRPRIVAVTASPIVFDRRTCLGAGMDDFLAKPVGLADYARVVAETPAGPPSAPVRRAGRRVLYVDDDQLLVDCVERILSDDPDLTVYTAGQGDRALELAARHQPDVILLDLHLPDMGGEAVLRRLRAEERTRGIPVVVVSGEDPAGHRLAALGASDVLSKPFEPARLRAVVDALTRPGPRPTT